MLFLAALILVAEIAVQAHYTFPRLVINNQPSPSDWLTTRRTKNADSKTGIENPTSPDIRCYQAATAASVATIPAGATLHYLSTQQVNHPGPTQYYLARVPVGGSVKTWDGSGAVWFKIGTTMPSVDGQGQMSWPAQNSYQTANTTIPVSTPSGDYLLRVEHIALHMAMRAGGAQFYLACSQVTITGGGDGSPGPMVAFPGAYGRSDPGILVDLAKIVKAPDTYQPPGPAVWTG
ncbi:lytic polysaccharide monooxygenase [Karstenula rhodostoma CBS 690.94]|uniref:lytic cellulose monooxygenase (C4-dehydrogenating) n=1 Tax=Karstenula rhodostoma CBS 690.94 TaxID=1392251 RepID=A0A9P4UAH2_9PLEO|nr:lytic polysaccharide monooxygenase [Karstenula rhodostoma CBS 690.94]